MAQLPENADDPILRALRRLHLTRANGEPRTLVLVAIAWVPMMIGALLRLTEGREQVPILFDISVHARILIALPLLIIGRHLLSVRLRGVRDQLYNLNLAPHEDLDRIYARSDRLRDSPVAAIVIVVVALLSGLVTVTNIVGPTGIFSGIEDGGGLS